MLYAPLCRLGIRRAMIHLGVWQNFSHCSMKLILIHLHAPDAATKEYPKPNPKPNPNSNLKK